MDHAFWRHAWQHNLTGWHLDRIHPALARFWPTRVKSQKPVLVPLCGKSLDMVWLAGLGHEVTGVELEPLAIEAFFREQGMQPHTGHTAEGLPYSMADGITLVEGDFFAFMPQAPFSLFYDRAALIALPPEQRSAYLDHLARCLAADAEGLLITFEYRSQILEGPPFSVPEKEVRSHPAFNVELLERRPVASEYPGLIERGAEDLHEVAYWLRARNNA